MATNWQKAVSQEDFNELNAKVGNSTDDETKVTLFGKIAKVFQAVSSGKSKIATAITGKGIATLGSDTFAKMAGNINLIKMVASGDASKILAGQAINGISGTATNDANAVAGDMLSGKTGYVKGLKVSGNMVNNGAVATAIASGALKKGYTDGGDIANLVAGNVKKGVNIGGIAGVYDQYDNATTLKTVTYTGVQLALNGLSCPASTTRDFIATLPKIPGMPVSASFFYSYTILTVSHAYVDERIKETNQIQTATPNINDSRLLMNTYAYFVGRQINLSGGICKLYLFLSTNGVLKFRIENASTEIYYSSASIDSITINYYG